VSHVDFSPCPHCWLCHEYTLSTLLPTYSPHTPLPPPSPPFPLCPPPVQLTDVDPPYGKAPTAQLAEKLPEKGRAGEVFDTTREMLLETQVRVRVCWDDECMCRGGGGVEG
jgi:hypothetical protein